MLFNVKLFALLVVLKLAYSHSDYHTYDALATGLANYARNYSNRTYLYSIGKSVEGRDLWVIAIANHDANKHLPLRPEVKFIGNIHGNELPTGEVLMNFVKMLLKNPENDSNVNFILNTVRVHVLVMMNPDGMRVTELNSCTSLYGSNNSNNFDLNLNFPDRFFCNQQPIQPETTAVLNWLESNHFVLSAKFHTGGIVTTYPYENFVGFENATEPKYSPTEDDDVFRFLAKKYSSNHPTIVGAVCNGLTFADGITNGAAWFPPIPGGMEDVNYWKYGTYEITMEISCCLTPHPEKLAEIWNENKKSLIEFTKSVHMGVRGIIKYQNGLPAKYLSVQINSREPIFKTDENGEYYILLLPGYYNMTVMFNCDPIYSTRFQLTPHNNLTTLNITLDNSFYTEAFYYQLNKYALFCTAEKAPIDCTRSAIKRPTTTTTTTEKPIPIYTKPSSDKNSARCLSDFHNLILYLTIFTSLNFFPF